MQWIQEARSRRELPQYLEKPLAGLLKQIGYEYQGIGNKARWDPYSIGQRVQKHLS